MRFPLYKQLDAMDCGPTCLRMVAKYYGKEISIESIRNKVQTQKEGSTLLGLSIASDAIGLRSKAVQISFENLLGAIQSPVILHWRQNHFVVLYKIKKGRFFIADPALGTITLRSDEFKSQWLIPPESEWGIILTLEPTSLFQKIDSEKINSPEKLSIKFVYKHLIPHKKMLLQLLVGLGLISLFQLVSPFLTKNIVDIGVTSKNLNFITVILVAQLSLLVGRLIIEFLRGWLLLYISMKINISILTNFLTKLIKLPISFFEGKQSGDIIQRINDHSRIESFLTGSSLSIFFSFFTFVIFAFVLAFFNTTIFFVFALSCLFYTLLAKSLLKKRKSVDYKRFEMATRDHDQMVQMVQGMQEVKLQNAENKMKNIWLSTQMKLFNIRKKNLEINQWQQLGALFINEGRNILITFLSVKAVINGEMTLGSMIAIQFIVGQLNNPLEQFISFNQNLQTAKLSLERLNEIHTIEDEEPASKEFVHDLPVSFSKQFTRETNIDIDYFPDNSNSFNTANINTLDPLKNSPQSSPAINFENVSFTYPGLGNSLALNNISLKIPKGKITAIVGTSGSGKTTLIKLLLKFYSPQTGKITLDQLPLCSISHKKWRKLCGAVLQDSYIFPDTIANNITLGDDDISTEKLNQAIELANLSTYVESLPLKYYTKIGPMGSGISAGQRQRILIARAMYKNPEFIFFDEATNNLDSLNERMILKNLDTFFKGRTVIIVAHRLSTVKNADQIVVLNKGIITEIGTHETLIKQKGEYNILINSQLCLRE